MSQTTFSRAPFHMRYTRKSYFEPKLVSIGPHFYHEPKLLKEMDSVKSEFTNYFFSKQSVCNLADLVDNLTLMSLEQDVLAWYGGEKNIPLKGRELFEMLARDSCFIIRIIIYLSREADSMFSPGVDVRMVRLDLLLLENQIPYFILKMVYKFLRDKNMLPDRPSSNSSPSGAKDPIQPNPNGQAYPCCLPCCFHRNGNHSNPLEQNNPNHQGIPVPEQANTTDNELLEELRPFIGLDMPWKFNDRGGSCDPDHLLDLYWKCSLPPGLDPEIYTRTHHGTIDADRHESWVKIYLRSNASKRIPNACELHEKVGVSFRKREHNIGYGVTFQNGVLQLPHLQLDQSQATLLVNLVAFEDFKSSKERILTSYILLLDGLVNTEKDVELLQQHGIITNKLSSIQEASIFVNDIGSICLVDYKEHHCRDQFEKILKYRESWWKRQFQKLRLASFSSPWAVISLLAGTTLLALAIVQTVFNIGNYKLNKHHFQK